MKERGAFGGWIRARLGTIILLTLVSAIFTLLLALYKIADEAFLYGLTLTFAVALCFAVRDYRNYAVRHRTLCHLREEITVLISHLPAPATMLEADYQRLVVQLFDAKQELWARTQSETGDMLDYYTLWAHQIKTPISAMRLLLQSGADDRDALQTELLHIEQYVDMVLSYLRLGSESSDFVIRTCSLDDIIRKAVRKFSRVFIAKKLTLYYEPCGARVLTDEKWLTFVLEQLLSNALKYTRSGSITIEWREGILLVRDTGIGIAPEDLPRVFDKGYTGYNGRVDQKATGIGLFLCRKICRRLGHGISVESRVGEGTTVSLDLRRDELEIE